MSPFFAFTLILTPAASLRLLSARRNHYEGPDRRRQSSLRRTLSRVRMEAMPSSCWDVVIFDYGRVLSLAPSSAELQEFATLDGVPQPPFFEIYSATRHDYDSGRADFRQH